MGYADNFDPNPYAAPASDFAPIEEIHPSRKYTGYAGFWRRFAAYLIDSIVLNFVFFGGLVFLGILIGMASVLTKNEQLANQQFIDQLSGVVTFGWLIVIFCGYYPGLESSPWQATLGKKVLGIEVTDLEGHRISYWRALGRFLGKIVSGMLLLIGYLMAAFSERKQALHDMMAGTLVLKTR